jgi:3-isopropylmalate/(R)-2-methylmalate dehydratase large subunit
LTMANMAIEAGAKNGIFEPNHVTQNYMEGRACRPYKVFRSDENAFYADVREYDVGSIEPQVAFPHLPSNTKPISEVGDISVDQVVIGSCTNGHIEDLRVAAQVLHGNKVAPYTRLIVIPATQNVYRQALQEGLIEIFLDAKAVISTPTCGPCVGGHMGVLAQGERAIATTNRNFVGRMGHPESEVYLSNPAVAAASAVKGRIAHPEEVVRI